MILAILAAVLFAGVGTVFAQDAVQTEEPTEEPSVEATTEVVTLRETAPDPANVVLEQVASGFRSPLYLTYAPDGSGRIFVLQQPGQIFIMQDGEQLSAPFLDLSNLVSQDVLSGYSERGLLGLAFHPDYAENGYFYVNYTSRATGATHVSRFSVAPDDPNIANAASEVLLMTIEQPYANHNGGQMSFGPDGYLYISVGDGGSANDPLATGQNPSDLLGSLLRIDVDTEEGEDLYAIPEDNPSASDPGFAPEVWAYGLRNVWRFSFDRATGDVYIADVGQNRWEEINFIEAGTPGGMNFGWNVFEGSTPFAGGTPPEGMIYPFAEYQHGENGCSVTGGYVYRGEQVSELEGVYLFGDYCSGRIWASYRDTAGNWQTDVFMTPHMQISSFGEDEAGELYIVDYGGRIFRFASPS